MKTILTVCFIGLVGLGMSVPNSWATDLAGMNYRIQQLKGKIDVQIERIKRAGEKSDTQMSLARIRLAEQLRRSEDDLYRQEAALKRFQEQLADQATEVNSAMTGYRKDLKSPIKNALADVEAQLQKTSALMAQMETTQNELDSSAQDDPGVIRSAGRINRSATGFGSSKSQLGTNHLPDMRLSPQSSELPCSSQRASLSKAKGSSDTSDLDIEVTTPDTSDKPTVTDTSTTQPEKPALHAGG
jgi:hypothetical protein